MTVLAALAGVLITAGVIMAIAYFRPAPPKLARTPAKPSAAARWGALSRHTKRRLGVGAAIGLLVAIITAMPVMVIVVPAAMIGLPMLLGKQSTRERDLLLALETWARALASTAGTGNFTLREVIGITRGSVPDQLRQPVDRLYARMSSTWSSADALRRFAAEMNSAYVDEVVIYLIQAAEFNAGGLSRALTSVADSLSGYAKLRIDLQIERDKPRRVMRTMTGIVAFVLVAVVLFSGTSELAFYKTPAGAVILALILASFVALLAWAKVLTRVPPEPRIILADADTREAA